MKLTDAEKAMLAGDAGKVRQKAMELLVRYGEAVGAEKLVATNNVCGEWTAIWPLVCEFGLDGPETLALPAVRLLACQLATSLDSEYWQLQGATQAQYEAHADREVLNVSAGIQRLCTCAPYLASNVPVKGEHCAWAGSAAAVYINSVLGARTNRESDKSTLAAMLAGRIPCWGLHLPEKRLGTHLVNVVCAVESALDWGLLGFYTAQLVAAGIPVFNGIRQSPNLVRLKHLSAAASLSDGIGLFHIPGITAEVCSLDDAFGGGEPLDVLRFGRVERMLAYDMLNAGAEDSNVDLVILGCPHCALEELGEICRLLAGKKISSNAGLWIFTPRAVKSMADHNGYTCIISGAGGVLMSDTCPVQGRFMPRSAKVAATNSAKQAKCLSGVGDVQCWFGSTADCIAAAVTGYWRGGLNPVVK
ncbi:aconitase X [Sporomusa aerivorans]|uniref:aconitase X n=1 Tax=Sporomusa aerivorans TaxID=204936 RepID=UPI00352A4028